MHIDSTRRGFEGNNSRRLRRGGNSDGPLEIQFDSVSTSEAYFRGKNEEALSDFNDKVRVWGNSVKGDLKASISSLVAQDEKLSNSLKDNYWAGKKKATEGMEIDRIGFSFKPEGVYIHLGVGRGYHRNGGVTSRTAKNSSENLRRPKLWFNPPVELRMSELEQIVSDYSSDIIVNYSRIFILS